MDEVKSPKKKNNSKAKKKKELIIGPRLQLEPTLTPKPSKPVEKKQLASSKKRLEFLSGKDDSEIGYLDGSLLQKSSMFIDDTDESTGDSKTLANSVQSLNSSASYKDNSVIGNKHNDSVEDYKTGSGSGDWNHKNISSIKRDGRYSFINSEFDVRSFINSMGTMNCVKKKSFKRRVFKSTGWNDRELMDLAIGLQSKGFADLNAVADCIKTKKENDISAFLNPRIYDMRKIKTSSRGRPGNKFHVKEPEVIKTWPNVRKWRRLASDHMLNYARRIDYSRPVIEALCKKFYEEEKETTDPEVINVKLIYKYMMDCMAGNLPPQLPPKESVLVLDLLREVRLIPIAYDFEEERQFLNDFKAPTKFRPFEVKDEFKRRFKKAIPDNPEANTVAVPEEVFMELSRHKKVAQCFNPLVTPVWMLQKEQECLESYQKESNVYVD